MAKTTLYLNPEDRKALIKMALQQPAVQARRTNTPTFSASIDNIIYALESAQLEQPKDHLLRLAYLSMQQEYPLHFAVAHNHRTALTEEADKLPSYKAIREWSH